MDDNTLVKLIDTRINLNFEIEKDGCYWEQRARINWLKFGDKNTKFFHSQATQRKRKNSIHKLMNEEGRELKFLQDIEEIARFYFQKLFTSGRLRNNNRILAGIEICIQEEDNQFLTATYTREEIKEAVFDTGPTKALGDDGFPAVFYQKCWQIMGEDVMSFCSQILNGGIEVSSINSTNIVLIPKVIYKIITKVIC